MAWEPRGEGSPLSEGRELPQGQYLSCFCRKCRSPPSSEWLCRQRGPEREPRPETGAISSAACVKGTPFGVPGARGRTRGQSNALPPQAPASQGQNWVLLKNFPDLPEASPVGWPDQGLGREGLSARNTGFCFSVATLETEGGYKVSIQVRGGCWGGRGPQKVAAKISFGAQAATGSCCSHLLKSQTQVSGAPQRWPPDAHAWSPLPPANESVTPQSSKVCVVTVSIIYLFTRLQFSACLSNSIIDRELAASRRSAGLRANSLRRAASCLGLEKWN